MQLTILGSGNFIPQKQRKSPGYLLDVDKKIILLDISDGTTQQIVKANYNILDVSHIFITHTHTDHIAGLPALLWPMPYLNKKKLTIYGPPKFKIFYKKMAKLFTPNIIKSSFNINIKELKNNKFKLNNLTIQTIIMPEKMGHIFIPHEIGYKFSYKNKTLCFCGDGGNQNKNAIISLAKNCNLLIIENGSMIPTKNHLHPELVGEIANKSKVKKIVVSHLPPEANTKKIKTIISKYYKGQIIIAKDLMKIKI